jgi:hypothetical protein
VDTDVSRNVVVFQLKRRLKQTHAIAEGPTRADDCVQQAWSTVQAENGAEAKHVSALHSEWEPSASDLAFIHKNFPKAKFTYNFRRPGPDGWEAAFAAARQAMAQAGSAKAGLAKGGLSQAGHGLDQAGLARAKKGMRHVADHGELLPVLWSNSSPKRMMLDHLPHHALVPGRLFVALAMVAKTPHGTTGMSYVTHAGLEGRRFYDMLGQAAANLTQGLQVEGRSDPARPAKGQLVVLSRSGPLAASALALPGFRERLAVLTGSDHLLAAVPEPDTLVLTGINSGWAPEVKESVLRSPCEASEMVPTLLSLTPAGIQIEAERQ